MAAYNGENPLVTGFAKKPRINSSDASGSFLTPGPNLPYIAHA